MKTDLKTAVLLINLGTPDSPLVSDVRSYLSQFLNDPRVIDLPWLARKLLVNLIIVPFRAPKSAKVYRRLWTDQGSPLRYYSTRARDLLQETLGGRYEVFLAMRYKNPSLANVLRVIEKGTFQQLIVLPMFPHYAAASTGSAHQEVMRTVQTWWCIPKVSFISQYYDHPDFIRGFVERAKTFSLEKFDHIVFSYHGLPERHVNRIHKNKSCEHFNCEVEINSENAFCYRATCYATTRLLVAQLGISTDRHTVSFQSRLDNKWLKPFSDEVIRDLANKGKKRVLVFSPAFTADCLETLVEIGYEYREDFLKAGGEELALVPSLNDHPLWIRCMEELVRAEG
jgi:protoporphyrin/coproporphyrin ferrochelatase